MSALHLLRLLMQSRKLRACAMVLSPLALATDFDAMAGFLDGRWARSPARSTGERAKLADSLTDSGTTSQRLPMMYMVPLVPRSSISAPIGFDLAALQSYCAKVIKVGPSHSHSTSRVSGISRLSAMAYFPPMATTA